MNLYSYFDIDTPALLIEKSIVEQNLANMQRLADSNGINLRPHIKTHKSVYLAKRQLELGACGIACAKISEAEVMSLAGISDIQIANIIVGSQKIQRLLRLYDKLKSLSSCVDHEDQALPLGKAFAEQNKIAKVFIKVDTGLNRNGIQTKEQALELAQIIIETRGLEFAGILTHGGCAYSATTIEEIKKIGMYEGSFLVQISKYLQENGIQTPCISAGSTPTAQFCATTGITELRPGNYIYNDMIQCSLNVAKPEEVGLSILSTVIGRPAPERAVIDAGSKSLSLDRGAHNNSMLNGFGHIVGKKAVIERVSEEHGVIIHNDERFEIGEKVRILPNHSCAVSNLFNKAYIVSGNQILTEIAIEARGCVV